MKRLLLFAFTATAFASTPAQDEIASALTAARAAWQYDVNEPIEIRLESLNACNLAKGVSDIATVQVMDAQTTLHFDDGTETPPTHSYSYVIRLNSSCDWSKLNLRATIVHEYGHIILGADYHSRDKHSVMFPLVQGAAQYITDADRSLASAMLAKRSIS